MTPDPLDPPFEILAPAPDIAAAPVVFNSPHSGARYPAPFLAATRLDALTLRRSEDAFVDELFLPAVGLGAPLMRAHFPRAFLDVNREPYELDPRMFEGRLPADANTRSLRVAGGLGTIARVVGDAQEIYAGRLPVGEALGRIEALYKPYHASLRRLLDDMRRRFGAVLLVDCHSMPSTGLPRDEARRADIVLGDRYGTSCAPFITDRAEQALRALGFAVMRNRPYAGGYITEHYGSPAGGLHALQIEINRALYMDEARHERGPGFAALQAALAGFLGPFIAFVAAELGPLRWAAE
ncbi:MAG TPA: N-formylglutamate amidohydrolase [Hyphomicrobiales bacterium]|nr:N-formylglutamate amidohydrolase [Hyphomicrobiales bacterium]